MKQYYMTKVGDVFSALTSTKFTLYLSLDGVDLESGSTIVFVSARALRWWRCNMIIIRGFRHLTRPQGLELQ